MAYNTKKFDFDAHYGAKSTKELQDILKNSEQFAIDHPQFEFGWHNEFRQKLRMMIAERIGK